jgi:superfamily II DNA or RNA helicase
MAADDKAAARPKPKTPHTRRPAGMTLEEWQIALRREFGEAQDFSMENTGTDPVFSEFIIHNPKTGGSYRVAVRGQAPGENYCSCPDFAVNTLGTCKHIEFALARLRGMPGGAAALARGFRPLYSSVYLRYGRAREVVFKAGAQCPAGLAALAREHFDENNVLRPESFARFDGFLKEAGKFQHELRCYEDVLRHVAQVRDHEKLRDRIDEMFPRGAASAALDKLLKVPMYPYQKKGALFAARAGRSVLADDMGLGKTVQAIAAGEVLARAAGIERVLVICPTSLKHQWKEEIGRFAGRSVEVVEGLADGRRQGYASDTFYKIISYNVVHRDAEAIRRLSPDLIILDEAQRIKNWKTRTAQSVKRLESQYAIVLTGTPLENRLEELHSIVEFVDRFHLGPRFRFLAEHQITEEADGTGKVVGYKDLGRIAQSLSPILLRRTKGEVLKELPERLEKKYFVEMTPEQLEHHRENGEVVARIVAKWRHYKFLSDTDQRRLMIALQNMRMSCNSTYLLDKETDFGRKSDELMEVLAEMFEDPEAKAVVFSQWLLTHELIKRRIHNGKWKHVFFHGGVPGQKRKDLIAQFKNDPACRLFLATDAGGVGLNLQAATAVVNMDLPWNPAVLEQRIGRVHRLGQRRPVRVINFIAAGTIEHGMLSLLDFKKSLFAGVLDGGQDEVFLGGSRLKMFMESVEKATGAIPPAPPLEETPAAEEAAEALGMQERRGPAPGRGEGPGEEAWNNVLSAGMSLLDSLGKALAAGGPAKAGAPGPVLPQAMLETDSAGRQYLKLPMPGPETLRKVADLIYGLTGGK